MKLIITLDTYDNLDIIREMVDKASIASYPKYSRDSVDFKPTLVCIGKPSEIEHLRYYTFKYFDLDMTIEKGY